MSANKAGAIAGCSYVFFITSISIEFHLLSIIIAAVVGIVL